MRTKKKELHLIVNIFFIHLLSKDKWQIKIGLKILMYLMYVPSLTYGVKVVFMWSLSGHTVEKTRKQVIDQFVYFRQRTTKNLWVALKMIRSNVDRGNHCIIF